MHQVIIMIYDWGVNMSGIVSNVMTIVTTVAEYVTGDATLSVLAFGGPLVAVGAYAFHRLIGR